MIVPRRLAECLHVTQSHLARLARVHRGTMATKPGSPAVQAGLGKIVSIIVCAEKFADDEGRAIIWFRHQPIRAFGRTPAEMVEEGRADAVMRLLENMDQGIHA